MAKINWYGQEPSKDPTNKGRKTSRINNAIWEAKNYGMDYVRAKYGTQLTKNIESSVTAALHGPRYNTPGALKGYGDKRGPANFDPWKKGADWSTTTRGGIPRAEVTVDALTGKDRTSWDSSRFTGDSHLQHPFANPNDPNYVPPPAGPPVWHAQQHFNLENDEDKAQGNARPGDMPTVISGMIDSLLRQSQNSAGNTLTGMFSQYPGQYYLGGRDSSSFGVDPVYAAPGDRLPLPPGAVDPNAPNFNPDSGAPQTPNTTPPAPSGTAQPGQAPGGLPMPASDLLQSSLGGFGFLSSAALPGQNVNTTQSFGSFDPNAQMGAMPGQMQPADTTTPQPTTPKTGWQPDGKGGWVFNDKDGKPMTTPPANSPPKPTTPSPIPPATPTGDTTANPYDKYGNVVPTPKNASYNPWGYGLGAGGVDASGNPVNATMGPSPAYMANATMQAMSLANSYFAPQRLELAYQLGDMETDMRRMAVNLGRQVDDPVLQAKLFKEANQATRTLDTQQNTFAFQMAEQRRQEEQQNWQFYSSLAQEEYKFSNQLDLAQRTFNLQRYQVMNSNGAPPVTNAFAPQPQPTAGMSPQPASTLMAGSDGGQALQGGNLLGLNPYKP
jgi:hypothetical protein